MKLNQVWKNKGWEDPNKSNDKKAEMCKEYCEKGKLGSQSTMDDKKAQLTSAASNAFKKAQGMITKAPQIQQIMFGTVTGWATGFVGHRIGMTAAFIGGGSVLLIVGANQAGIININWDKFGKKIEQTSSKLEAKVPAMKGNFSRYARGNTYFVAGFVGGFLLGLAS